MKIHHLLCWTGTNDYTINGILLMASEKGNMEYINKLTVWTFASFSQCGQGPPWLWGLWVHPEGPEGVTGPFGSDAINSPMFSGHRSLTGTGPFGSDTIASPLFVGHQSSMGLAAISNPWKLETTRRRRNSLRMNNLNSMTVCWYLQRIVSVFWLLVQRTKSSVEDVEAAAGWWDGWGKETGLRT